MTTFGLCLVRDAVDIIGPVVEHMLTQVDHVIVADNLSTDGTREVLDALPITVIDDPDPAYHQSTKTTALAMRAADLGATWVVPFDADELWYSPFGRIGDVLTGLGDYAVASAALYDHVPTALDPPDPNPLTRMGWRRRNPGSLPKVAVRPLPGLTIHMGNHGCDYGPLRGETVAGQLVVRHFPYRSPDQFVDKALTGAAALAMTDLPADAGAHWRQYAALEAANPGALAGVFREHFWSADPTADRSLIFDPAPGGVRA